MSTTTSNSTSSSDSTSVAPYDQWQQWAQKQRKSRRQEAQELIYAEDHCDQEVQHHMELPHKKRASLLDDDDDDDECDDQAAPWKVLPKLARKSLLDDDDDEEEVTPPPPLGADALFVPPTELRRSDDRTDRLLTMHMLSSAEGNNTNTSTRSLSLLPAKGRSKNSSFDATAPLSMITALSSRRQYNKLARNV